MLSPGCILPRRRPPSGLGPTPIPDLHLHLPLLHFNRLAIPPRPLHPWNKHERKLALLAPHSTTPSCSLQMHTLQHTSPWPILQRGNACRHPGRAPRPRGTFASCRPHNEPLQKLACWPHHDRPELLEHQLRAPGPIAEYRRSVTGRSPANKKGLRIV